MQKRLNEILALRSTLGKVGVAYGLFPWRQVAAAQTAVKCFKYDRKNRYI